MKPEGMFPCEMGQSCDGCDATQCPVISKDHRDAMRANQRGLKICKSSYDEDDIDVFC